MIHGLADPNDPTCLLWGDGAGAVVLEGGDQPGFVGSAFQADGAYASDWAIFAGGTFEPASVRAVKPAARKYAKFAIMYYLVAPDAELAGHLRGDQADADAAPLGLT
jgi:3-oxoacyl-[acyl-carrier-protein] synthase III